ncbi:uncharacterized protein LOC126898921 [Daktulosphaira vitifoliae]|uniref:uncharacterized protein LOC126898921 n=1 Tax=Daktulosphaira vitifoliae TaxID=58002 RepID=UPI0021AABB9E|nr:uncharacterized protein LOC126898921 [Daktulosphaira vitifoliae]XP_050529270.1 uncharacterized protein LOC126898921 [Daktulosphaira vitifoliae]XP_050529271.1 uncharacterized protein LOC126898921 [Daktulosphaira vitifoliae]
MKQENTNNPIKGCSTSEHYTEIFKDDETNTSSTIKNYLDISKNLSETDVSIQNTSNETKFHEMNSIISINSNIKTPEKNVDNCELRRFGNTEVCMNDSKTCRSLNSTEFYISKYETSYNNLNSKNQKTNSFTNVDSNNDENSQNFLCLNSSATSSNEYTCFLSQQVDSINNLTPFKRTNSYFIDSPVKKICTTSLNHVDVHKTSDFNNYSINNDDMTLTGLTSVQSNVDSSQDRYDGSDSGFGSEMIEEKNNSEFLNSLTNLSYKNEFISSSESTFEDLKRTSNEFLSAMEVLKPKFTESVLEINTAENNCKSKLIKGILKHSRTDYLSTTNAVVTAKKRKNINFANVTVFYFPRVQGFTCVPSQGGSTLGMTRVHCASRIFSLPEYMSEQRRIRRNMYTMNNSEVSVINSDDSDSDTGANDVYSESEADIDSDSNGCFLQPVPSRQRRALLRAAGVEKIDASEKDDCKNIRLSREFCGCLCRGFCDPDTCACFQAGITCQVDRMNFPCGCTIDGCGNSVGRIQFNPTRVRKHFIHTLMKLEIKKKETLEEENKLAQSESSLLSNFPYDSQNIQPYYSSLNYGLNTQDYNYGSLLPIYDNHPFTVESNNHTVFHQNIGSTSYETYQHFSSNLLPPANDLMKKSFHDYKPETFTELVDCYSFPEAEINNTTVVPNIPSPQKKDSFSIESDNLGEIIKNTIVESVNS